MMSIDSGSDVSSEHTKALHIDKPQHNLTAKGSPEPFKPRTLYNLFRTDCQRTKILSKYYLTNKSHKDFAYEIEYIVCGDFETKTLYLSIFLPKSNLTFAACKYLSTGYKGMLDEKLKKLMEAIVHQKPGEAAETWAELKFSGRIYIYHETRMLPKKVELLMKDYKEKGLSPQFRGRDYEIMKNSPLYEQQ